MPSMKPDDPAARRAQSLPAPKRGTVRKVINGPSPAMTSPELAAKFEDASSGSGSVPSSPRFTPVVRYRATFRCGPVVLHYWFSLCRLHQAAQPSSTMTA
jgi:hypothetical protein